MREREKGGDRGGREKERKRNRESGREADWLGDSRKITVVTHK